MVFCGKFLSNRVESYTGVSPGFEDNEKFAETIIDFLTSQSHGKIDHTSNAYALFRQLERLLGILIKDVLCRYDNFEDLIPDTIRKKLHNNFGQFDYSLATYIHLVSILKSQWQRFEPYFSSFTGRTVTSEELTKMLFNINADQRIYLAHPHKAEQLNIEFGPDDVLVIQQALEFVRGARAVEMRRRH